MQRRQRQDPAVLLHLLLLIEDPEKAKQRPHPWHWPPPLPERLLCHKALDGLIRGKGFGSIDELYMLGEGEGEMTALRAAAAAIDKPPARKTAQVLLERLLKAAAAFRQLESGGELVRQRSAERFGLAPSFTFRQFWAEAEDAPELLEVSVRVPPLVHIVCLSFLPVAFSVQLLPSLFSLAAETAGGGTCRR
eukprot:SAG11_NODE_5624_length_1504_cov_1.961566_2_plen_192_part_00